MKKKQRRALGRPHRLVLAKQSPEYVASLAAKEPPAGYVRFEILSMQHTADELEQKLQEMGYARAASDDPEMILCCTTAKGDA
jgi:hypothetical protein